MKGTESSQWENEVYAQWWKPGAVSQRKGSPNNLLEKVSVAVLRRRIGIPKAGRDFSGPRPIDEMGWILVRAPGLGGCCLLAAPLLVFQCLLFFTKEKFAFVSSGRAAALEAGNVYGEVSTEAVKNTNKKQTVHMSLPQSKAITTCCGWNKKVRVMLCKLYDCSS